LFRVSEFSEANIAPKAQKSADLACLVTVINASNLVRRMLRKFSGMVELVDQRQRAYGALALLRDPQRAIPVFGQPVLAAQVCTETDLAVCDRGFRTKPFTLRTILLRVALRPRSIICTGVLSAHTLQTVGPSSFAKLSNELRPCAFATTLRALLDTHGFSKLSKSLGAETASAQ
jgi:hypothetical protein